ncbi:MAG: FAD-dependent oxidoreductase [Bacteroidales bacterium]|nr:FAD-dependent oxidoreductase [Bacteroidales bacterium]
MSLVKKYIAEVVNIANPIDNIYCVELKSTENRKFTFSPGQFLHLSLETYDPSFPWPESRCFSMQSSPSEENVRITFAVKGNYTLRMAKELHEGKTISLKMPFGNFFNQFPDKNNCVFIAGGTGITPFLSLFLDESFKEFTNPKLYFGLRNENYNIYQKDVENIKNKNLAIKLIYENSNGKLDIAKFLGQNGIDSTYLISGPFEMIKYFKIFLINNNILPNKIITDEWE